MKSRKPSAKRYANDPFASAIKIRSIKVGDYWGEWDLRLTPKGFKRIPRRMIGRKVNRIKPQSIFIRPLSPPSNLVVEDWPRWQVRDRYLYP